MANQSMVLGKINQEVGNGKSMVCGAICLDQSGALTRVSNKIYTMCRAGTLSLPGFPDFGPIIQALKKENVVHREKSYRVSCQLQDRLLVLQVYAQKWLDTESTRDRAMEVIKQHNEVYNGDGEYWYEERTELNSNNMSCSCDPAFFTKLIASCTYRWCCVSEKLFQRYGITSS